LWSAVETSSLRDGAWSNERSGGVFVLTVCDMPCLAHWRILLHVPYGGRQDARLEPKFKQRRAYCQHLGNH
jgi:hypothetical protein